jgi:hypothetical protein
MWPCRGSDEGSFWNVCGLGAARPRPREDESNFLLMLEERGGATLQSEMRLLKIGRLVPEYVTQRQWRLTSGTLQPHSKGLGAR